MKRPLIAFLKLYRDYKKEIITAFFILLYYVFYNPLIDKIVNKVAPYLEIGESYGKDVIFGLIFLFSVLMLYSKCYFTKWKNDLRNILLFPVILFCLYLIPRIGLPSKTDWTFSSFHIVGWLKYFDSIFLAVLVFAFNSKKQLKRVQVSQDVPQILEDDVFNSNGEDILKRHGYAQYIGQLILNKTTKNSFAICIKGQWGSGKSVFLRQLEYSIHQCVKIRFNPWLSKSSDNIVSDFFKALIDKTAEYDNSLSKSFEKYSDTLQSLDETFTKKIFSAFGFFNSNNKKENSLFLQIESIKKSLKKERLKIVVFIDDLDRLNGDEIMSVLKLIRNSFNFPDAFFIVAYDESYVKKTIKDKVTEPEKFLEKIFQLEIDLPSVPVNLIESQLMRFLNVGNDQEQKQKLKESFEYISSVGIVKEQLKNIRDMVRFSNSFNHMYWKKFREIDSTDFFLLEILKLKSRDTFNNVRDSLIQDVALSYLKLPSLLDKDNTAIRYIPQTNDQFALGKESSNILHELFNRASNFDEIKSIRYIENSIRYFSDDLFGNISYSEFDSYRDESFVRFKGLIDSKKEDSQEIIQLILRINNFGSLNEFFNINKSLLYIYNIFQKTDYTQVVVQAIEKNIKIINDSYQDEEKFNSFFERLLVDSEIDAFGEVKVLGHFMNKIVYSTDGKGEIVSKELLLKWLLENMNLFIKRHKEGFNRKVFDIYYEIIDRVENQVVIIHEDANKLLSGYILENQSSYFSKWLIRPKFSGNIKSNSSVLEPFVKQYLGYEKFEELLFSQENSVDITKLQGFFQKFKHSGFTEVEYDSDIIEIRSDKHTQFLSSPQYNHLVTAEAVELERRDKYVLSSKYPLLAYSKWITQIETISLQEAILGGIYIFRKSFYLPDFKSDSINGKLFFLVDDFVKFEINNNQLNEEFSGFDQLLTIDISQFLQQGLNEIIFNVRNIDMTPDLVKGNANNNPFDFIYYINISFKK